MMWAAVSRPLRSLPASRFKLPSLIREIRVIRGQFFLLSALSANCNSFSAFHRVSAVALGVCTAPSKIRLLPLFPQFAPVKNLFPFASILSD